MSRLIDAIEELKAALVEEVAALDSLPVPWMGMSQEDFYRRFEDQEEGPQAGETVTLVCGQCDAAFALTRRSEYRGRGNGVRSWNFYEGRNDNNPLIFTFEEANDDEFGQYAFYEVGLSQHWFLPDKVADRWPICSPACAAVFAARLYAVDLLKRDDYEQWRVARNRIKEARALLAGARQLMGSRLA